MEAFLGNLVEKAKEMGSGRRVTWEGQRSCFLGQET